MLGPPYCGIGATIRIGREIRCLPYAGFFLMASLIEYYKILLLHVVEGAPSPVGWTSRLAG